MQESGDTRLTLVHTRSEPVVVECPHPYLPSRPLDIRVSARSIPYRFNTILFSVYRSNDCARNILSRPVRVQGSTFKTQILSTMARNSFFNEKMLPYNLTSEGAELYNSFLDSSARAFPAYLEEIRGMADGTNLSFSKVRRG